VTTDKSNSPPTVPAELACDCFPAYGIAVFVAFESAVLVYDLELRLVDSVVDRTNTASGSSTICATAVSRDAIYQKNFQACQ
jgi:hypothetical protein